MQRLPTTAPDLIVVDVNGKTLDLVGKPQDDLRSLHVRRDRDWLQS